MAYQKTFHLLAIGGTATLWMRSILDGTVPSIFAALHSSEPYVLPGTNSVLQTRITGIYWPIDYLLNVLVVFFWEAVDGSHPAASAIGIYFLIQYFAILTMLLVEQSRVRSYTTNWKLNGTLWLLAFQAVGLGCAGPLWAMVYLTESAFFTAPHSEQLRHHSKPDPAVVIAIPGALLLGYVLPAILMSVKSPELVSNSFQQSAIVVWNTFPVWVACFQTLIEYALRHYKLATNAQDSPRQYLTALRVISMVAIVVSFAGHAAFLALAWATRTFPSILSPEYQDVFTFSQLFLPELAWPQVTTIGDGVRAFFLWDQWFGYATMIMFAAARLHKIAAVHIDRRLKPTGMLGVLCCVFTLGPGATCALLSWIAEELLFETPRPSALGHKTLKSPF